MKEAVLNYLKKHYYWRYRFDRESNFITFDQWCINYVNQLTDDRLKDFIKRNKILN